MLPEYKFDKKLGQDSHYHHTDKGCEIITKYDSKFTIGCNADIDYRYCKTHNVYCTKTGWEFGWYLGRNSRNLYSQRFRRRCRVCGEWLETNKEENRFICQNCIDTKES